MEDTNLPGHGWAELPSATFVLILPLLGSTDIKTMRCICQNWRRDVDANLTHLTPRSLDLSMIGSSINCFSMIDSLDCSCAVGPSAEQLSALVTLSRLEHLKIRANYTSGDAALALIVKLQRLTCLILEHAKALSDGGLTALSGLSYLAVLSLKGADGLHGGGLSSLRYLAKMRSLDVSHCCNLDYRGLKAIADLSRLTSLCLSDVDFERERPLGVMSEAAMLMRTSFILLVSQLSDLQELYVHDCKASMTDPWFAGHLTKMVALTKLDIGGRSCLSFDAGFSALRSIKNLKYLNLDGLGPFGGSAFSHLSRLSQLEGLNMSISQVQDKHIFAITRLSLLRTLVIIRCPRITEAAFALIGRRLSKLQCLHIGTAELRLDGLRTFPINPIASSLQSLRLLECPRLTARIGPFVSHFKGLTALDLAFSDSMTGQITEYLGALTSLQNLSLSHCELVTSENIGAISELTSLRFLDLSATRAGEGMKFIAPLTALTCLGLAHTGLTDASLQCLKGLRHMRRLSVNGTDITDSGLQHLSGMTALQSLDVNAPITSEGIIQHLQPLAHKHSLAKLYCGSRLAMDLEMTHRMKSAQCVVW